MIEVLSYSLVVIAVCLALLMLLAVVGLFKLIFLE